MSKIEDFITAAEEAEIIEAIRQAEMQTSGEIKIHLEKSAQGDAYDRALDVFKMLKMDQTKLSNGVLIYVAVEDRTFVIFGDEGINNAVGQNFWDSTKDTMQSHFRKGEFKQGLVEGILMAGQQLKKFFPWEQTDKNEISDDISIG